MNSEVLEAVISKSRKKLVREEATALVSFKDSKGNFFCGYKVAPKKVTLYFQPLYDHPESFESLDAELKPHLKGKSCLHFKGEDSIDTDLISKLFKLAK